LELKRQNTAGHHSNSVLSRHRGWVLAITSVGAFMGPFDGSVVSVALPAISSSLRLTFSTAILVQASYLVALTILLIPVGRLADAHGRGRLYLLGAAAFAVTSLLSAIAPNATWLITARALQGSSSALLSATSTALVTQAFPDAERGRALGINLMAVYLGLSAGPVLGGLIVNHAGWQWIFLVNVPIGLATVVAGWHLLSAPAQAERLGLDPRGIILLSGGLISVTAGLTFAPLLGWLSPAALLLLLGGIALLLAFGRAEMSAREPLIDPSLFLRNRVFAAANLAALLNYTAMFAVTVLTAILLELVQRDSAEKAGLLLVVQPLMMAVLSPPAGRLSDRFGSRLLAAGGMVLIATGMLALAAVSGSGTDLQIVAILGVIGVGMAAFSSPNTSAVMGSVDRSELSLAASVLGTMRFLGQSLSLALLGGLAASRLGVLGGAILFTGAAPPTAALAYAQGFRIAMLAGSGLALSGAAASLIRGPAGGGSAADSEDHG